MSSWTDSKNPVTGLVSMSCRERNSSSILFTPPMRSFFNESAIVFSSFTVSCFPSPGSSLSFCWREEGTYAAARDCGKALTTFFFPVASSRGAVFSDSVAAGAGCGSGASTTGNSLETGFSSLTGMEPGNAPGRCVMTRASHSLLSLVSFCSNFGSSILVTGTTRSVANGFSSMAIACCPSLGCQSSLLASGGDALKS